MENDGIVLSWHTRADPKQLHIPAFQNAMKGWHGLSLKIRPNNGLWLLIPILLWNLIFSSRLTQAVFLSDRNVPGWVLGLEVVMRILVFALPLFFQVEISRKNLRGLSLYFTGTAVYFASWLPLLLVPESAWSASIPGLLAPYVTPLISFLGIAAAARSRLYGFISVIFILVHTSHGLFALQVL